MNNSPSNIFMVPKFFIPFLFFVLSLTTTHAKIRLIRELAPSPNPNSNSIHVPISNSNSISSRPNPTLPNSNSTPSHAKPTPIPNSNSTSSHPKATPPTSHAKPTPSPNSNSTSSHANQTRPNSNSPPSHAKPTPTPLNSNSTTSPHAKPTFPPKSQPTLPPKLKPTSPPKSKPTPKPVPNKKNATSSPYQFSNHFCLSRRLDVKKTFCLQVLRSSPNSTKANDNLALLTIVANSAIEFSNKNIALFKKLSAEKTTKPDFKTAITDCVSAYEGYLKQFKTLVVESKIEAQLAGYDSELATLEINRCVKALGETKNADEIEVENEDALDYARLAQNIADAIE